jgi:hypothetical protein
VTALSFLRRYEVSWSPFQSPKTKLIFSSNASFYRFLKIYFLRRICVFWRPLISHIIHIRKSSDYDFVSMMIMMIANYITKVLICLRLFTSFLTYLSNWERSSLKARTQRNSFNLTKEQRRHPTNEETRKLWKRIDL